MARPSLKQQRSEQIIDAYETCVARYGVEGATLERIAAEAGLARPLIRHNVGNRDALMQALLARFEHKSQQQLHQLAEALPNTHRLATLLDWLFDPAYSDTQHVLVASALVVAAPDNREVARQLTIWLDTFIEFLTAELSAMYVNASNEDIYAVASGVCGIYSNVEAFAALQGIERLRRGSKQAAQTLVNTLAGC